MKNFKNLLLAGATTMKFTLDTTTKAAEVAGHYNGTLTYTASIINQ